VAHVDMGQHCMRGHKFVLPSMHCNPGPPATATSLQEPLPGSSLIWTLQCQSGYLSYQRYRYPYLLAAQEGPGRATAEWTLNFDDYYPRG